MLNAAALPPVPLLASLRPRDPWLASARAVVSISLLSTLRPTCHQYRIGDVHVIKRPGNTCMRRTPSQTELTLPCRTALMPIMERMSAEAALLSDRSLKTPLSPSTPPGVDKGPALHRRVDPKVERRVTLWARRHGCRQRRETATNEQNLSLQEARVHGIMSLPFQARDAL